MALHVTQCSHCKTVFPVYEDNCPCCHRKAKRGRLNVLLTALACAFFLATMAALTSIFHRIREREKIDVAPARVAPPKPSGSHSGTAFVH